jgi:hypothetical protein
MDTINSNEIDIKISELGTIDFCQRPVDDKEAIRDKARENNPQNTHIPYILSLLSFPASQVDDVTWARESAHNGDGVAKYNFSITTGFEFDEDGEAVPVGIPYGKLALLAFYAVCNYCPSSEH